MGKNKVLGTVRFHHLALMTAARVSGARKLARFGQKSEARQWFNFIEQSEIIRILQFDGRDTTALEADFNALRDEVHPLSPDNVKPELERACELMTRLENFLTRNTAAGEGLNITAGTVNKDK